MYHILSVRQFIVALIIPLKNYNLPVYMKYYECLEWFGDYVLKQYLVYVLPKQFLCVVLLTILFAISVPSFRRGNGRRHVAGARGRRRAHIGTDTKQRWNICSINQGRIQFKLPRGMHLDRTIFRVAERQER